MAVLPTLFSPALGIGLRDSCLLSGDLRVAVRTVGLFPFGGRKGRTPQFQVCVWLGGSLKAMKKEYRCGLLHLSIAMYNYYT
jgi:hypothetical protein